MVEQLNVGRIFFEGPRQSFLKEVKGTQNFENAQ
jgi:hypothetical protein